MFLYNEKLMVEIYTFTSGGLSDKQVLLLFTRTLKWNLEHWCQNNACSTMVPYKQWCHVALMVEQLNYLLMESKMLQPYQLTPHDYATTYAAIGDIMTPVTCDCNLKCKSQ